jgi:hypothetical protein
MTSYLQQLVEQQPIAERYPPRCWPADHEPWRGHEHRIAGVYAVTRELADILRQWIDVDPRHPDAQRCAVMLRHFNARWKALFASWDPQGLAAN